VPQQVYEWIVKKGISMTIHSADNRDQVQTYQEPPTVYAANQQNNNYDVFPPPAPSGSGQQAVHTLRIVLLLLAIVCLGSLGAVPLATNFLPASFVAPAAAPTKPVVVRPTSTPLPTMPGGECTATPQKMNYASSGPASGQKATATPTPMLPSEWLNSGHTQQDFGNVQACAAAFVTTYENIDANDFRTLEASTDMLSSGAKLRFYGRLPGSKADNRMDPLWRAVIQKQNLKQTAQAAVPSLLSARYSDRHLYVWMLVSYHLSIQRNGQQLSLDSERTVLLVDTATQAGGVGTGWQVSGWGDGDVPFAIPNPV
jgi:hypothetical protein